MSSDVALSGALGLPSKQGRAAATSTCRSRQPRPGMSHCSNRALLDELPVFSTFEPVNDPAQEAQTLQKATSAKRVEDTLGQVFIPCNSLMALARRRPQVWHIDGHGSMIVGSPNRPRSKSSRSPSTSAPTSNETLPPSALTLPEALTDPRSAICPYRRQQRCPDPAHPVAEALKPPVTIHLAVPVISVRKPLLSRVTTKPSWVPRTSCRVLNETEKRPSPKMYALNTS